MVRISDNPHQMFEKSLHRRNDSEEIDVFEAAKYFSGGTNEIYPNTCSSAPLGVKDGQCSKVGGLGNGISLLDNSMRKATQTVVMENQSKEKKHKQPPSSPGGRIAKILNALFNQTSLKKGKSKTSVKDDEETTAPSPDWRRKRRSSISNFQPQYRQQSSQSFHSGFRTPPPAYVPQTPKASSSYRDFRCYSDHKEVSPYALKNHRNHNPALISIGLIKAGNLKHAKIGFAERFDVEDERYSPPPPEEREFTKYSELADGGADSDSSSDLFDLPNCDGNHYSIELPVYETTHIQSIKTRTR